MNYLRENINVIEGWIQNGWQWGQPVDQETLHKAREGDFSVVLTPVKPVPPEWYGDVREKQLLGLASGGGQQMPLFAAAGAIVTSFDYSDVQLNSDRETALSADLLLTTVKGDMAEPLPFENNLFDIIFHPVSNCYIKDILPVWKECQRILKPGGILLAGFDLVINYIISVEDETRIAFPLPFDPLSNPEHLQVMMETDGGYQFSHSLEEQLGGILKAGLRICDLYEDTSGSGRLDEMNIPTFMAVKAVKPQ